MKCPHCGKEINAAAMFASQGGSATSRKKAAAARRNAKLGGRPKKKRSQSDANVAAKRVVDAAARLSERPFPERPKD